MSTRLKDENWRAGRQSILLKYDKNGDGIYDTDEVNAIVDDYMDTIRKNVTLIDTNKGMKKLLIFAAVMILLLSLSNLGTALLAAHLAKEITISSDGKLTSADGKNTALKTMSTAYVMTSGKSFSDEVSESLMKQGVVIDGTNIKCFDGDEVVNAYNAVVDGGTVSLQLYISAQQTDTHTISGSAVKAAKVGQVTTDGDPITNWRYGFPDRSMAFVYNDRCVNNGQHFKFIYNVAITWTDTPPTSNRMLAPALSPINHDL
eukprot:CAMPEP_0204615676 /NCGR_PEP_ID=MMETSP0717-20131115/3112_1 /ASSEMBLY_ACC=CAM_ASM_000666 /TAXON_ID=230516 /ORGANISM="Chaetoceros curvisetus" /LENGTH=259 /DNA_ID=CAMNT_0051628675 /DNA_START=101 /DNA_END=880 /DNA_ORIENTATION=+